MIILAVQCFNSSPLTKNFNYYDMLNAAEERREVDDDALYDEYYKLLGDDENNAKLSFLMAREKTWRTLVPRSPSQKGRFAVPEKGSMD